MCLDLARSYARFSGTWMFVVLTCTAIYGCKQDEEVQVRSPAIEDIETDVSPQPVAPQPLVEITTRWLIEPAIMIGSVDEQGPDLFGAIKGVAPLSDGSIAVLDGQVQEVRIFSQNGEHQRTFGTRGQGPGEFVSANGLVVGPDNLIRVHDPGGGRVSLFDPIMGFVDSEPIQITAYDQIWNAYVDRDGNIHELALALIDDQMWRAVKVYSDQSEWIDTVRIEEVDPRADSRGDTPGWWRFRRETGLLAVLPVPFWPWQVEALDPSGYFWTKPGGENSYRIVQTGYSGDTVQVFHGLRTASAVTQEERDSAIASIRAEAGGGIEFEWAAIPTQKPIVESIFFDDRERVWIKVHAEGGSTVFDIFTRDGRYEGTAVSSMTFQESPRPTVIGNNFYALHTDELGVPFVVRAEIREVGSR